AREPALRRRGAGQVFPPDRAHHSARPRRSDHDRGRSSRPRARSRAARAPPAAEDWSTDESMSDTTAGPTSHTYFSQRLRLHYVDWGDAGKPPLLLLHGGRDHCRNWDWTAAALRNEWHVIAPDLRGHGDSQWSQDGSYS